MSQCSYLFLKHLKTLLFEKISTTFNENGIRVIGASESLFGTQTSFQNYFFGDGVYIFSWRNSQSGNVMKTVLVVDDSPTVRNVVSQVLQVLELEIIEAKKV